MARMTKPTRPSLAPKRPVTGQRWKDEGTPYVYTENGWVVDKFAIGKRTPDQRTFEKRILYGESIATGKKIRKPDAVEKLLRNANKWLKRGIDIDW